MEVRDFFAGGEELRFVVRFHRGSICLSFPLGDAFGALAIHRDGRDFSDRECDAFRRLRPHVVQAYRKRAASINVAETKSAGAWASIKMILWMVAPGVARCGLPAANMVRE